MPLYEFECKQCQASFEELLMRPSDPAKVLCPRCGSAETTRLLSAAALASGDGASAGAAQTRAACAGRGGFT